jgi:hypothetical protein
MVDLDMDLTPNFKLWEFITSPTADRLGLDNIPSTQEIANLVQLCDQILQPARNVLGPLRISSGYRSSALNKAVGGAKSSDHLTGFAADIIPISVGTRKFAEWVVKNCNFDQVILEFGTPNEPNWIHISADPGNRKQILRASKSSSGKTVYKAITLP